MKRILKFLIVIVGILGLAYVTIINLPQANIKSKKAVESISAVDLYRAFEEDEKGAEQMYQDKVINVKGVIGDMYQDESGAPVLIFENPQGDEIAMVTLEVGEAKNSKELALGVEVEVKALCTGKLMEVVLSKGLIQK